MSKSCRWFLIAGLIAPGSALADMRYTFEFSGSDLRSAPQTVTAVLPLSVGTVPGMSFYACATGTAINPAGKKVAWSDSSPNCNN